MSKAGYCTVCGENVYLTDDGGCIKGHPSNCITGVYEVADTGQATTPQAAPVVDPSVAAARRRMPLWLKVVLVIFVIIPVIACCSFGAFVTISDSESTETASTEAPLSDRLKAAGLSEVQATNLVAALKQVGINRVGEILGPLDDEGLTFDAVDGDFTIGYTAEFDGDAVSVIRIGSLDLYPKNALFKDGKPNGSWVFYSEIGSYAELESKAQAAVRDKLKYGSSAEFADDFEVSRDGNKITLQGTVNAQNSFGARGDARYLIVFEVSRGKDGVVRVEPMDAIIYGEEG